MQNIAEGNDGDVQEEFNIDSNRDRRTLRRVFSVNNKYYFKWHKCKIKNRPLIYGPLIYDGVITSQVFLLNVHFKKEIRK